MKKFLVILSLGCLAALLTASSALADHARPKGASPLNFRLVPAYAQCTGSSPAGMTHGPPLAVPSCSPPNELSNYLTANAPDRPAPYNTAADGTALITLTVTCLVPGTTTQITGAAGVPPCSGAGDQEDVKITNASTGVRCQTISGGCAAEEVCTAARSSGPRPFGSPTTTTRSCRTRRVWIAPTRLRACQPRSTCRSTLVRSAPQVRATT